MEQRWSGVLMHQRSLVIIRAPGIYNFPRGLDAPCSSSRALVRSCPRSELISDQRALFPPISHEDHDQSTSPLKPRRHLLILNMPALNVGQSKLQGGRELAARGPRLQRVTWWRERNMIILYFWCFILCINSATTGYDGYELDRGSRLAMRVLW